MKSSTKPKYCKFTVSTNIQVANNSAGNFASGGGTISKQTITETQFISRNQMVNNSANSNNTQNISNTFVLNCGHSISYFLVT